MNKHNNWQNLLRLANEALNPKGISITLTNDGDGFYKCEITVDGKTETYAENYYEDELSDLVTEAWHDANAKK